MRGSVVLVTGGAGFIGSHVVDRLIAAGHRPRILDTRASPWHAGVETVIGDVRRLDDVLAASRGCAAICHLAAAADVNEVHERPAWATELNALGTLNVLEAARLHGTARVVYASTVWVYSDVDAAAVDEDTPLVPPAHLYTAGKLSGELYCRSYAELYGVSSTVLRFGIPYGPRARPAAVIPAFVGRALRGEALSIAGTGDQERSFVYVEDLAEGVVRALAPEAAGRTYNLAGRETTTVRELADLVCAEVAPTAIVHTPGRSGDLRGAEISSDRAEDELGWRARTPLAEGVRRYAAWVQATPPSPEPVPAARLRPRVPAGVRRVGARLASGATDPVYAGTVALLAVLAATLAVLLGTEGDDRITAIAIIGGALLVPLWSLTATEWPAAVHRAQALGIGLLAVLSVLLLGAIDSGDLAVGRAHVLETVVLSGLLTSALHVVPRRLAAGSA
ncbi:NAD-dependent epimerase/dehydratase family protein [Baekduia soli]|uniref:NAD-dependent epimerase/dehydratase family protein n=1 Tax=Baekduia soli TaxID=496014 RepID=A0A5B8U9X3_9ACTN|nr:NAD-dependent epimerase/dehydratase family protein [Baekduia soli]QEC49850.1 NAD-dependent epimerase/dehydratase family protein [Baekduia soli]